MNFKADLNMFNKSGFMKQCVIETEELEKLLALKYYFGVNIDNSIKHLNQVLDLCEWVQKQNVPDEVKVKASSVAHLIPHSIRQIKGDYTDVLNGSLGLNKKDLNGDR